MKTYSHGCTLDCFDCCKFNILVDDDNNIKIQGDKEHPYTRGIICKKGRAHLDRLNHPDRIYTPLLKVDGKWIEISFEEAIELISKNLNKYKKEYTSKSVIHYDQYGSGSILKNIGDIFFNFYGGVSRPTGGPCWSAGIKACEYDYGNVKSNSIKDLLNSKSIIIWGKNPAYTTIHTMDMIKKAKLNGAKIVVIDPIKTSTASIADKYISIKPSSDGALAMAMAKIIIERNLHDEEFINNYVLGFEEYKSYLETLELEYLLNECGVSKVDLYEIVDMYVTKYSSIQIGYGIQKYRNGGNTVRAINALGSITGQIGFSGGGVSYANRVYPDVLNLDPYNSKSYGKDKNFKVSEISGYIINSQTTDTPIKSIIVTKSNLLNQLPNLNDLEKAFEHIEFKVCLDMFMTDTAKLCDLFIPCTNTLESEDIIYSSMTNPYITYNEKVLNPKHKLMDEYYFFMELAKKMNISEYPTADKNEYLSKVIEPLKVYDNEVNLEKIRDTHVTIDKDIAWEDKIFSTISKKYELYSNDAKEDGLSPIPTYKSSNSTGRFNLLTNHTRDSLFSQHFMDKKGISKAYINEKMAINIGIEDEEVAILKSNNGDIQVEINIDNNVGDYVVKMYVGWWKKHGNPNFITESIESDMGGQIAYNETLVDIIKQK